MIKTVWVVSNSYESSRQTADELRERLSAAGFRLDEASSEVIITVGGDGTLLHAMHDYEDRLSDVKFVGVHTGHLGFYTDFVASELDELVKRLTAWNPADTTAYPLLRVCVTMSDGSTIVRHALNESTLRRQSRTLVSTVKISGELFETFRGDGLSISTPTGSTAYNKSIGGAVIHPQVEALQLAEIASLNNNVFRTLGSPMIVAKKDEIAVCPEFASDYVLTIDQLTFDYKSVQRVSYRLDGEIQFANLAHTPFWERVRNSFIRESGGLSGDFTVK